MVMYDVYTLERMSRVKLKCKPSQPFSLATPTRPKIKKINKLPFINMQALYECVLYTMYHSMLVADSKKVGWSG